MCGRYGLSANAEDFIEEFDLFESVEAVKGFVGAPRYDIRPSQEALVITQGGLQKMRWGFHPPWSKRAIINTRSERIAESKMWRGLFQEGRCLIPATFFYEWQQTAPKKTAPWMIALKRPLFAFAGLWGLEKDPQGEDVAVFSILTEGSYPKLSEIHNKGTNKSRQPLIIMKPSRRRWLQGGGDAEELIKTLQRPQEQDFVTRLLYKVGDDATGRRPLAAANEDEAQGELF